MALILNSNKLRRRKRNKLKCKGVSWAKSELGESVGWRLSNEVCKKKIR